MPIYEARPEGLQPLTATSFEAEGWRERGDIQRLLKDRIASLEDGLLVLTDEFSGWADSTRRIDLLCLDDEANLVVVELKRNEDGGHMELQALRYAAMVSAMTFDQAVDTLARYRNRANPDPDEARADILAFLGWSEPDEDSFAIETRIILAAADFGKELTTSVLWLRDRGIDIRCVRLKPYRMEDGRLLLDIQQLIPLPEAEDFQTKLGEKRLAERRGRAERHDLMLRFWQSLLARPAAQARPDLNSNRTPKDSSYLPGRIGRAGITVNYVAGETTARVEFLFQRRDGKELLHRLMQERAAIEADFGGPLDWREREEARQCRVVFEVPGGYRSPEEDWPNIQDRLIDAMARLDAALRQRVLQLLP